MKRGDQGYERWLCKTLCYLLRHAPGVRRLPIRRDGYVCAAHLLAQPELGGVDWAAVLRIVRTNYKQRFGVGLRQGERASEGRTSVSSESSGKSTTDTAATKRSDTNCVEGLFDTSDESSVDEARAALLSRADDKVVEVSVWDARLDDPPDLTAIFVRAYQGHSVQDVDIGLICRRLTPADFAEALCVHGTTYANWARIKTAGLSRMRRAHIHFARGLPGDPGVVSGIRQTSELALHIDARACMVDGIEFYLAKNGVVLSAGDAAGFIAPRYFTKVTDLRTFAEERAPVDSKR